MSSQRSHQPRKYNETKALYAINTKDTRQYRATVRALAPDSDLKGSEMQSTPQLSTRMFLR